MLGALAPLARERPRRILEERPQLAIGERAVEHDARNIANRNAELLVRCCGWRLSAGPSGGVEGMNNKAKLIMRKSYSFRTFGITEIALYQAVAELPEPRVAHRFF